MPAARVLGRLDSAFPWILFFVFVFLVLGLSAWFYARNSKKHAPDYRVLFVMGVVWLPIGLAMKNYGMFTLGIVFLVVGLVNRDKWRDEPGWAELPPVKRNLKFVLAAFMVFFLLLGFAYYLIVSKRIVG